MFQLKSILFFSLPIWSVKGRDVRQRTGLYVIIEMFPFNKPKQPTKS